MRRAARQKTRIMMSEKQCSNIGISANAFTQGGGSERYARDIASGLKKRGIDFTVYARRIDHSLPELSGEKFEFINTSLVPRIWRQKLYDFKLGRRISQNKEQHIFAINHTIHADISACVGTHIGYLNATSKSAGLYDKQVIAYERTAYQKSRLMVAHSELMRSELETFYGIPSQKIRLLYPPCDTSRFVVANAERRLQIRHQLGFPDDKVVFLFVSTGHARKGYGLLARVFSQTKLPILLAVAGRPIPRPSTNIVELGYRTDIEAAYQAADYTILASQYEPFGLVCVESILCGTPVVMSKNIGSAEIIGGSSNLFFEPNDETSLRQAIESACRLYFNESNRIALFTDALKYDPSIEFHVDRLVNYFDCLQ